MMTKTEHRTTEPAVVNVKAGTIVERIDRTYNRSVDVWKRMRCYEQRHGNVYTYLLQIRLDDVITKLDTFFDDLSDEATGSLPPVSVPT